MKKFAMAAVAAAALSAGVAQAYTVGTFSNGFVVPNVIHNGPTDTTAVGLINQTGQSVAVYWTFFDQNSTHITDGCFAMTNKDYEPFIWSQQSGGGLSGTRGYLVFAAGATTAGGAAQTACGAAAFLAGPAAISGNAFQVDSVAKDVAFVPVIDGPLTIAAGHDVTKLNNVSLTAVAGAAQYPVALRGDPASGQDGLDRHRCQHGQAGRAGVRARRQGRNLLAVAVGQPHATKPGERHEDAGRMT